MAVALCGLPLFETAVRLVTQDMNVFGGDHPFHKILDNYSKLLWEGLGIVKILHVDVLTANALGRYVTLFPSFTHTPVDFQLALVYRRRVPCLLHSFVHAILAAALFPQVSDCLLPLCLSALPNGG